MAEDDESHRKVAVKVAGVLAGSLSALAVAVGGWGISGRGSWQATAAQGLAVGLLIAALSQGLIWILMHVRRPAVQPDSKPALPTAPAMPLQARQAAEVPSELAVAEIDENLTKLRDYQERAQRALYLLYNGGLLVRDGKMTNEKLERDKEDLMAYLNLKLHPTSKIVAGTAVFANFHFADLDRQPTILQQAMGVLTDEREKLTKNLRSSKPPGPRYDAPPANGIAAQLEQLLSIAPKEAIERAWNLLASELALLAERERLGDLLFEDFLVELGRRNVITPEAVNSITGLHKLVNLSEGREVTVERAREFLTMADAMLWILRSAARVVKPEPKAR